jgi:trk system potassium uptake protein TrkA
VHVVVVGCGRVGSELAMGLERLGHTVSVVDKNPLAFKRLPEEFLGEKIVGFGFDRDHLKAAGIEKAEALAAVSNGDNSNILTARIARETFGIESVVARIYDPRRALIYQKLGIPTVASSRTTGSIPRARSASSNVRCRPTGPGRSSTISTCPVSSGSSR